MSKKVFAIVLGSGLSSLKHHFPDPTSTPFHTVLDFQYEKLEGHERIIYKSELEENVIILISGRLHYYEGFTLSQIYAPYAYALRKYDVDTFIFTSTTGALSPNMNIGHWHSIDSVLSLPAITDFKPFDDRKLFTHVPGTSSAVYAFQQGPSLGTVAEYKMLHKMGADLVGMSVYPEWLFASSIDRECYFLGLPVCRYYPFTDTTEPTHEEVISMAQNGVRALFTILKDIINIKQP